MDKGYYNKITIIYGNNLITSQSTIKMDKGYYNMTALERDWSLTMMVAIHNKNGQGLLL